MAAITQLPESDIPCERRLGRLVGFKGADIPDALLIADAEVALSVAENPDQAALATLVRDELISTDTGL